MRDTSYVPEAQMCLHPVFKNPDKGLTKIVRVCGTQLVSDPDHPHLRADEHTIQRNVDSQNSQPSGHEGRVEEEFDRWLTDTITLECKSNGQPESVLDFWKRQEETNTYHFLPRVARILFANAIPISMLVDLDPSIDDQPTTTEWEVPMASVWDDIGDEEYQEDQE
ncbi:hypothetical protein GQ600_15213 [Phytophthora cactorum]|nr:hypothetical protein GQ600_15213 [Phytophthora cactorum]